MQITIVNQKVVVKGRGPVGIGLFRRGQVLERRMVNQPVHDLGPMVEKLGRHSALSDADRRTLLALPFEQTTHRRGFYLVREGERPGCSFVVLSGYLYCRRCQS